MLKMLLLVIFVSLFFALKGFVLFVWKQEVQRNRVKALFGNPWIQRFVISSAVLISTPFELSHIYYEILRVIVTITACFCAVRLFDKAINSAFSIAVIIAVLFNPFYQIELSCLSGNRWFDLIDGLTDYWPIAISMLGIAYVSIESIKKGRLLFPTNKADESNVIPLNKNIEKNVKIIIGSVSAASIFVGVVLGFLSQDRGSTYVVMDNVATVVFLFGVILLLAFLTFAMFAESLKKGDNKQ